MELSEKKIIRTRVKLTAVFVFPNSLAEIQKDVEYRIPFTVNNSTISVNM